MPRSFFFTSHAAIFVGLTCAKSRQSSLQSLWLRPPQPARKTRRNTLFRGEFFLDELPKDARLFFSADDYAKIYVNGKFAAQDPAPGYFFHYLYCEADVSKLLRREKNVVAIHSYYQGLINRVWVSGDMRSGAICDLVCDGKTVLKTGASWKCAPHTGISSAGKAGYDTQFLENYDAGAPEAGFEQPGFDDSKWRSASLLKNPQYKLFPSPLPPLEFEEVAPAEIRRDGKGKIFIDFGAMYVGYFSMSVDGKKSDKIELRFGQELNPDGSVRTSCARIATTASIYSIRKRQGRTATIRLQVFQIRRNNPA